MPWSGSAPNQTFARDTGTYQGTTAWQQTQSAARGIRADDHDTHDQDIATALNVTLKKDGGNKPTADIDWGGYGISNLRFLGGATEASIASSGTTNLLASTSLFNVITGTATITSLGTGANRIKFVRFAAALILTHHATSLILPTGANITTAAGDTAIVVSDASSNARVISYTRADGSALAVDLGAGAFITEASAAAADQAGKGQVWVKDDTPNILKFTDDAGNDYSVAMAGTTAVGVGAHSIWLPVGAMTEDDGAPPESTTLVGATSGAQIPGRAFDASSDETMWASIFMPKSWAAGTLSAYFIWAGDSATSGNCIWAIRARAFGDNDADAAMGSAATVTDAPGGTAKDVAISGAATLTIAAAAAEELNVFEIYRDADNGSDTMTGDAILIGCLLVYTTDQPTDD